VNFDKTKFTLPAGLALGAFRSDVRSGVGLRPSKAG
jgi:hypothetical protein